MGATHGVSVAMLSSYIPAAPVPGLGRLSGTAWACTDLLLGEGEGRCIAFVWGCCDFLVGSRWVSRARLASVSSMRPALTSLAAPPLPGAGGVLAASNLAAGRLNDLTLARGWGAIGCFLGGAAGCAAAMALLALFAWKGELGRDDLLQGVGPAAPAAPAAAA